ncbi:hypothetical protein D3C71_1455390 [compost metagenome]
MHNALPVKGPEVELREVRNPRRRWIGQRGEINRAHQHTDNGRAENTEQDSSLDAEHHQNSDQQ